MHSNKEGVFSNKPILHYIHHMGRVKLEISGLLVWWGVCIRFWRRVVAMEFGKEWREGGDGLLSWVGIYMVVIFGAVLEWVRKHLVNTLGLRLGWGVV